MCVFIYMTYFLLRKDTSVVMLKSKSMECMHRRVVLRYVPPSLRSSCQAGGSKQHPEMIHSFLLTQSIPMSANYYINGMFSAYSLCVYLTFGLWLNFCPIHLEYIYKKMGQCGNMFDIGEQTHFLKVSFSAL